MNPSVLLGGLAIGAVIVAYVLVMPWARRFDRRVADRREARGKPRSIVPPWVVVAACIAMIIGGAVLMHG